MRATVFLGAFLLFLVQPLTAARALPVFGGGPVVWTVSLVVFQGLLVLGYGLAARVPVERWRRLLPFAVPIAGLAALWAQPAAFSGPDWPVLRIAAAVLLEAGPAYTLLAATTPLVTRAAGADHRLYALSNAGSVCGLLAQPLLLDPLLPRSSQRWLFVGLLCLWAIGVVRRLRAAPSEAPVEPRPDPHEALPRWTWRAGAALGTALLTTITASLAQDLSVTPLLWVLPLLVYLSTFILAFGQTNPPGRAATTWGALLAALLLIGSLHAGWRLSWPAQLAAALATLFFGAFAVHAELVRRRPADASLGTFYLDLALGGAAGTLTVGLLLPAVLPVPLELPLTALALWLFVLGPVARESALLNPLRPPQALRNALGAATLALVTGLGWHAWQRLRDGARWERSVFGAIQVKTYGDGPEAIRHLLDGRISHGYQPLEPSQAREPTTYFARRTGIGRLLSQPGPPRTVAIPGLGIGTLAAYGRPGDRFRFYEINPATIRVARRDFTYLSDSAAEVEVVLGDARVALAAESGTAYDLIVVDAFSGDAIPVHLITEEAVALYLARLTNDGVLAVNVSNNHADLTRVLQWHAQRFELASAAVTAMVPSPLGPYRSDWAFLAFRPEALRFTLDPLPSGAPPVRFTDDHAPLLAILR